MDGPQAPRPMVQSRSTERSDAHLPEPPLGEWLYKLQDEILGPVPASDIIERMFTGEVDESTPISTGEGHWGNIQAIADFHPFLLKAKAKIRAEQARLEAERAARARRVRHIIKVAVVAVVLVVVSFLASYYIIVSRPWRDSESLRAWAGKHVPLLKVAAAATMDDVAAAKDQEDDGINIDQILIDDAPALVAIKNTGRSRKRRRPGRKKSKTSKKPERPRSKPTPGTKTASAGRLSNDEITSVVYARSNLRRLYSCIRSEIKRNSDLPQTIVLDFTIANSGRVTQVRMDNIKLDGSWLHKCFRRKLSTLRFRKFSGEVRNVTIPFNIGS